MAEIYQFTIPRIPRSSNLDQDSGLIVRSQGTNSTFNNNIKEILIRIIPIKISFRSRYGCIFFIGFWGWSDRSSTNSKWRVLGWNF